MITIHDTITRRNVHCISAGEYFERNIYFKCKLTLSEYESEIDSRHYLNINVRTLLAAFPVFARKEIYIQSYPKIDCKLPKDCVQWNLTILISFCFHSIWFYVIIWFYFDHILFLYIFFPSIFFNIQKIMQFTMISV